MRARECVFILCRTSTLPPGSGGGGGSGGVLLLSVANLSGPATAHFDFSGGAGAAPGGGGGAGGVLNVEWLLPTSTRKRALDAWWTGCRYSSWPVHVRAGVRAAEHVSRMIMAGGVDPALVVHHFSTQHVVSEGLCDPLPPRVGQRLPSGNLTAVQAVDSNFLGTVSNAGGLGAAPGNDGGYGAQLSEPSCGVGQGGALCLPCAAGTYKNMTGDNSPCTACPPGTYANATGSVSCIPCDSQSISPGSGATTCSVCSAGFLPNANNTACSLCQRGYGGDGCTPCSPGKAKNNTDRTDCMPCVPGTFAASTGSIACTTCTAGTVAPTYGASVCSSCDQGEVSTPPYTQCST
ncbi:hypothetical protein EON62_00655 [archaeon]|nr:MAG: hypothetical protein EON62_00655 [archaeon]